MFCWAALLLGLLPGLASGKAVYTDILDWEWSGKPRLATEFIIKILNSKWYLALHLVAASTFHQLISCKTHIRDMDVYALL